MMQTTEKRIYLSHPGPEIWAKYAASSKNGKLFVAKFFDFYLAVIYATSSKNGKLFVADFSDFYLAVSASVNDANYRKPNSFITLMTRDMVKNMLPAVETETFLSPISLIFIWL